MCERAGWVNKRGARDGRGMRGAARFEHGRSARAVRGRSPRCGDCRAEATAAIRHLFVTGSACKAHDAVGREP